MIAQEQFAAKAQDVYSQVDSLLNLIRSSIDDMTPVHVIETKTLDGVLALGKSLMQLLFDMLGAGDVGPTCELPDGRVVKRLEELRTRPYQSVFGLFELQRCVYAEREGQKIELVPLDTRLALPESKFSFLLQDFDQNLAMEEPFAQVRNTIGRILHVEQHVGEEWGQTGIRD